MDDRSRLFEESTDVQIPAQFDDDDFYRALAARPRRRVLAHLIACEECSVEELADVLCGWETGEGMVPPERHEQAQVGLVHAHLPRLEAAGLASFDRSEGTVTVASLPEPVERLVEYGVAAEEA